MPTAQETIPSSRSRLSNLIIAPLVMAALLVSLVLGGSSTAQTVTVLHIFNGTVGDGYNPLAPVIVAPDGTLYGTTYSGGDLNCTLGGGGGCGTVFQEKLSNGRWIHTTIHEFTGTIDGCCQSSALTRDSAGRLYGVTVGNSFGRIFRMTRGAKGAWHFEILYTFQNHSDGEFPLTPLFIDKSGALYGITPSGSLPNCPNGCGAVFKITPPVTEGGAWKEHTLYQFKGGSDGGTPDTMILDSKGVIYGTTNFAGAVNGSCPSGCGVVFRLARSQSGRWNYSVLFTFDGNPDGNPYDSLFQDAKGALFGLAFQINSGQEVFKLSPPTTRGGKWTRGIVSSPPNGITYMTPGANGLLYGAFTGDFDIDAGNLFQLTPQTNGAYKYKLLVDFNNGPDRNPNAVTVGPGTLYGTLSGGSSDGGMVIAVK
jgi:hypothetical protein